jgi:DNA-binding response OmpR family regulator
MLIAEDDAVSRHVLQSVLTSWGYEVVVAKDGEEAWQALQAEDHPFLAILDWMMPGLDGPEICRKCRTELASKPIYLILVTGRGNKDDLVRGLEAGADDYLTKPFDSKELLARVRVGARVVELQGNLAARVRELENALARVKQLQGLLPICMYCKKVRNDANYWQQVDAYISEHSEARFSHAICPDCDETFIQPELGHRPGTNAADR